MADRPRHEVSTGQLFLLVFTAQIGLGVFSTPQDVARHMGRLGWMPIVLGGSIVLAAAAVLAALCRRFDASILEVTRRTCGRHLGFALNLLTTAILVVMTGLNLAVFITTNRLIFFKDTPPWVLTIAMLSPCVYLVAKGLKVIARFDTFVFLAVFSLLGIIVVSWPKADWSYLLPLTGASGRRLLATMPVMAFSYTGFELFAIYYPHIRGPAVKIAKAFLGVVGATILIHLVLTLYVDALFGAEYVRRQSLPLLSLFRAEYVPVLERMDIYFLVIWLPAMGAGFTSFFIAAQLAVVEIFPRLSYRLVLVVLTAILWGVGSLLRDSSTIDYLLHYLYPWFVLFLGIALPILLLATVWVRGRRA